MKPSSSSIQKTVLVVSPEQAGKRLDLFLTSELSEFSRTQIQSLIQKGNVIPLFRVKVMKAGLVVLEGQSFEVTIPPAAKTDIKAQPLALDIVF